MTRRLAVLISGAPRGDDHTIQRLKSFLRNQEHEIFVVLREEFLGTSSVEVLQKNLPNTAHYLIVPSSVTEGVLREYPGWAPNLIKMWHEIKFGMEKIPLDQFRYVLRIRPDILLGPGKLAIDADLDEDIILTPDAMSYCGTNDMIAFGGLAAMKKYAATYDLLRELARDCGGIPEVLLAASLRKQGVKTSAFNVDFCLYRKELLEGFDEIGLDIVATSDLRHHAQLRIGSPKDTPEARSRFLEILENGIKKERLFPRFPVGQSHGCGFYAPEADPRDGAGFRFMRDHAAFWRDADTINRIDFKVHFVANKSTVIERDLFVNVEGVPCKIKINGYDSFGRAQCSATPIEPVTVQGYRAKIGLFCNKTVVPSKENPKSSDHRVLALAIGNPTIL